MNFKDCMKLGAVGVISIVILLALSFGLGLFGLEYKKFFGIKHENVDRQIFEQTQSYVHSKTQDLAKYFEEYQKADSSESKEAIRSVILMRFAEFDVNQLRSQPLQNFLTQMRGY